MSYRFPLTAERDRVVRSKVAKRLQELHHANMEGYQEEVPGLKEMSGREALLYFREQPADYWMQLAATDPKGARQQVLYYGGLVRRYG